MNSIPNSSPDFTHLLEQDLSQTALEHPWTVFDLEFSLQSAMSRKPISLTSSLERYWNKIWYPLESNLKICCCCHPSLPIQSGTKKMLARWKKRAEEEEQDKESQESAVMSSKESEEWGDFDGNWFYLNDDENIPKTSGASDELKTGLSDISSGPSNTSKDNDIQKDVEDLKYFSDDGSDISVIDMDEEDSFDFGLD